MNDVTKSAKVKHIGQIHKEGFSPRIDILVYGLTAEEAHRSRPSALTWSV